MDIHESLIQRLRQLSKRKSYEIADIYAILKEAGLGAKLIHPSISFSRSISTRVEALVFRKQVYHRYLHSSKKLEWIIESVIATIKPRTDDGRGNQNTKKRGTSTQKKRKSGEVTEQHGNRKTQGPFKKRKAKAKTFKKSSVKPKVVQGNVQSGSKGQVQVAGDSKRRSSSRNIRTGATRVRDNSKDSIRSGIRRN